MLVHDAIKMATKRKHHEVTLKVKYTALKELEMGRPNKNVANQFSFSGITLATWKKSKEKIFKAFQNSSLNNKEWKLEHTKSQMKPYWSALHQCVVTTFQWIGPILLQKAHEFAKAFIYNNFTASKGWLRGWKER